jgi:predicted ribosomally synthesized peptide with SipW-like signal peptide
MLIGTTYAWFTDSVSSDNNTIQAGNLDIELYHTNKNDTEEQVTETTKLFDDVDAKLWEPNAMAYEKFLLKNVGDLDLEYQLSLNASNATVIGGVSFASMLKVAVITNETYVYDRATISSDTSLVWNDLATFELEGTLLDGANTMQESELTLSADGSLTVSCPMYTVLYLDIE